MNLIKPFFFFRLIVMMSLLIFKNGIMPVPTKCTNKNGNIVNVPVIGRFDPICDINNGCKGDNYRQCLTFNPNILYMGTCSIPNPRYPKTRLGKFECA